jgi:hypothetical protein
MCGRDEGFEEQVRGALGNIPDVLRPFFHGIAVSSQEEKAMTKQLPKTDTSAVNVADYIVERLAAEGIDHCFGVAGDYVFPICDAVDSSAKVSGSAVPMN